LPAKIDEASVDVRRYKMVRDHEMTIVEVATIDQVTPAVVQESVKRGRAICEVEQQMALRDARFESALENEKLRKRLRKKLDKNQLEEAIDALLTGEKIVVGIDPKTGEIHTEKIIDPETLAMGIEAASKILGLNEKPASTQVAINMNTQINNNDGSRAGELTYEDMIDRIHERQRGAPIPASRQIIETQATEVTEENEEMF
jgi:hypothetical protein